MASSCLPVRVTSWIRLASPLFRVRSRPMSSAIWVPPMTQLLPVLLRTTSRLGVSTTRVRDVVNRGPEFDGLYLHPPVLKACCRIINEPFRLSTMHARTLRPDLPAQDLHGDFERDGHGWTMFGFIFMVDEFRNDNGATRFVPGSHLWSAVPSGLLGDLKADYPGQVPACGPAGSMIVFNGSVWHGHTVNRSGQPRRSIQGAYIRRGAESGENLPTRLLPETLSHQPLGSVLIGRPAA